ncbi:hypothetical protein K432DRAFT_385858 [Lepidopterella palustris CBS 459.81]|uniref:Uncharacterized protein n=1 Tax=Lepidopterella palustris CBS 459.81 TaxID=1314670 RepID=A0A8E2JB51_9PEZI|nr:hypothetical protein K432DRAFT_385858 [Lepidopterella palustris CBS 459.81]
MLTAKGEAENWTFGSIKPASQSLWKASKSLGFSRRASLQLMLYPLRLQHLHPVASSVLITEGPISPFHHRIEPRA